MKTLSLSLIFVVVLTILGLGWGIEQFYASHMSQAEAEHGAEDAALQSIGKSLAAVAAVNHDLQAFITQWRKHSTLQLVIIDREDFPLPESLATDFFVGKPLTLESDGLISLYVFLPQHKKIARLDLDGSTPQTPTLSINILLTLIFYGGVVMVALAWVYPLVRRLTRLRSVAVSFGSGNLDARIDESSISYIADIEREFNHMADRIQTLVSDNKLLSRAVSHDLKTPLARLRFGFETLTECEDPTQREKYFGRIEKDMDAMEQLVETLLQYARLDESTISLNKETIELDKLIETMIEDYHHVHQSNANADQPPKHIAFDTTETVTFLGDRKYIIMMLTNIFHNATIYSSTEISIRLIKMADGLYLTIDDNGAGIPVSQRKEVFKPFVRGTKNSNKNGHGMGLAIADRIAAWHGADISISSSERLGGASFMIRLPN